MLPASPLLGLRDKHMKVASSNISNARDPTRGSNVSKSLLSTQLASADYSGKISMRLKELKKIKMSQYGKSKYHDSQTNHGEMDIATPSIMGKKSH